MTRRLSLFLAAILSQSALASPTSLFDGKTFEGWDGAIGTVWSIEDGSIAGGSLEGNPKNEFLTSKKTYKNFILKLEYKLVGSEGFVNGGVQFHSQRISSPPNEMIGFQADIGAGYSGSLYDESRRKKLLSAADKALIASIEKPGQWNRYEIRCEGPRIRLFLNDVLTVDYTETQTDIPLEGLFGLQIHGNCKARIFFRALSLEELP